jgi:hypothetical protein
MERKKFFERRYGCSYFHLPGRFDWMRVRPAAQPLGVNLMAKRGTNLRRIILPAAAES